MRAVVTRPGGGRAWLEQMVEPTLQDGNEVLVRVLRVGVCGTDRHVMERAFDPHRQVPEGFSYLVLGHEAVGRVVEVGPDVQTLQRGDLVVPTVRRGCGECEACAVGESDLCFTGRYRERGIVGLHGFLSERIVEHSDNLISVPEDLADVAPLVESLCTPEKALRRIGNARAHLPARDGVLNGVQRALVTGSGPIGMLAMLAFRLRNVPTWLLARQPTDGLAAQLTERAGATYVPLQSVDLQRPQTQIGEFDAIIEATGAAEIGVAMLGALARNGVLDLAGGGGGGAVTIPAGLLGSMLGRNLTMLGSVNANAEDWRTAAADLAAMRQRFPGVVEALITHRFSMDDVQVAFERVPGQIKALIEIDGT